MAFRLGIYVDDSSRKLESPRPDNFMQSWANVVTGMTADTIQAELDKFNAASDRPELTKVCLPERIGQIFRERH